MAKVKRTLWDGVIEYEEDDTPRDIRNFNFIGKSPIWWLAQSVGLHEAAQILKHDEQGKPRTMVYSDPIALMLGGYAVETLLKMVSVAAYVSQHGNAGTLSKTADFVLKTHDLKKLAAHAKLRINKSDRRILEKLTKYVLWGGKYPVPLQPEGYLLPALFDGPPNELSLWDAYVGLYKKLHRLATRKTRKITA